MQITEEECKKRMQAAFDSWAPTYSACFNYGHLRLLHEVALSTLRSLIPQREIKILDAGGGTGHLAICLGSERYHTTVLDLSFEMLKVGYRKADTAKLNNSLDFVQGDIESLPFYKGTFDFIICEGGTLSYVSNPHLALSEFARVLRPGGAALLTAQNRLHFMWLPQSVRVGLNILKTGRIPSLLNYNTANYPMPNTYSYTPEGFVILLREANFTIEQLGSRLICADRLSNMTDEKLEADPHFFRQVLDLELLLTWNPYFLGVGRTLLAFVKKTGNDK
jgi:ubiquinone/menaquinone biosynthesis C-methylase UbiE